MRIKIILLLVLILHPLAMVCSADKDLPVQEVVVRSGDTLWSVANKYLKDPKRWPEILKYNKLSSSDPNVILPGMTLKVPVMLIKEHLRNAELISVLNDVRYRKKNELTFQKASVNLKLYTDDAVRTFKESHAQIKFFSGEILRVDENSFIIIRPEQKQDEVNLLAGAVRASRARVLAADTVVMPKITPKAKNSDFKTRLKADKTTLVEVYEGIVDVTAKGKTVTLSKGFGTEVKYMAAPSPPKQLPPLPNMVTQILPGTDITARSQLDAKHISITLKNPHISSESKGKAKILGQLINKYHLQVASDRLFKEVVLDETNILGIKTNINFKNKNLPDGSYYYRIAYMDELGFEGQFTDPKKFTVDNAPPQLIITQPEEGAFIQSEFVRVEGRTEPGCFIKINNRNVNVEKDGSFQISIAPKLKEFVLNVKAEDASGNTAELHRSIIYLEGKESNDSFFSKPGNIVAGFLTFSVIAGVVLLIF